MRALSHTGRQSNQAFYHPAVRAQVYDEMFRRAGRLLADRLSVILDGTFPTVQLRRRASELAWRHAAIPLLIHCHCPSASARQRIVARTASGASVSDATSEIYERQIADHEPDPADLPACHVDTHNGLARVTEDVFGRLRPIVGLP